jgi:hypothetical protein
VNERKTTEIKLRVSPEEKTSWQLAAEQREVGLSQFIRDCVSESLTTHWNHPAAQDLVDPPRGGFWRAEVEDSSVAQAVPTSGVYDVVVELGPAVPRRVLDARKDELRSWMFEARGNA